MRISSIKFPINSKNYGIKIGKKFNGELSGLNKIVILTGGNGSGKSRFLKLIKEYFDSFSNAEDISDGFIKVVQKGRTKNEDEEYELTQDIAKEFNLINYAHFDARLQSSDNFSPYVIHQSKEKLRQCNYEETALNSLLYLKDLAEGYSEESSEENGYKGLMDFIEFAKELELELSWDKEERTLKIFNRKFEDAELSPGQIYALRMAIACKVHEAGENFVFLLDEPETHLHPSLLIKIINKLMEHFNDSQFFIATHSLPLISYLTVVNEDTTVFYMEKGEIKDRLRSNSEPILNNLIGDDEDQFAIRQIFASSEELACNKFCMECFLEPMVVGGGVPNDPSVHMAESNMRFLDETEPIIIVDFGAGEGRLLECMVEDGIKNGYEYYAYNVEKDDADYCKKIITEAGVKGKSICGKDNLAELNGKADRVFMVNVLHEISPNLWKSEFDTINDLLKDDGELIIIEREILTMGESPFENGYLMLTGIDDKSAASEALFCVENFELSRHKEKPYIIAYRINKKGVGSVKDADFETVFEELIKNALAKIRELRKAEKSRHIDRYKNGLSLAFWLNQLASALMCNEDIRQVNNNE